MRLRRRLRTFSRAACAVLAALSVLVSVVLAGHRYFFCAPMNEASLHSCCARAPSHDDAVAEASDGAPAIDREACCTTARFATPAPGTIAPHDLAVRAPLVAVLPAPSPIAAPAAPVVASLARLARAGPGDPSAREHRLRTMVFLT